MNLAIKNVIRAENPAQIEAARELFREYEKSLGLNLCFQNFDAEVANLPGKYAAPDGCLFLIETDGRLAGCVALRKIADGVCEMKRLFIRDEFRGLGLGKFALDSLLEEARRLGYQKMRLDTYPPKMAKAVKLYESYGFREIQPYYDNPYGDTLFMEKDL